MAVAPDVLQVVVSAIVGAGGFAGITTLYKAFIERKKVPADINMTILGGAEKALVMMKSNLDDAEARILQLRREIAEDRVRHREELAAKDNEIRDLQINIRSLREAFNEMLGQLDRMDREAKKAKEAPNDGHSDEG